MELDGSNRKIVYEGGWGIQPAPDGKRVSFNDYENGLNLAVMDLETGEKEYLLRGEAQRYASLYFNSAWSPDGKWIAFQGLNRNTGKREFSVVSTKGSDHGHHVLLADADDFSPTVSWHPKSDRIMVGPRSGGRSKQNKLRILRLSAPNISEPFAEFTDPLKPLTGAWSTDGTQIVFPGRFPTETSVPIVPVE